MKMTQIALCFNYILIVAPINLVSNHAMISRATLTRSLLWLVYKSSLPAVSQLLLESKNRTFKIKIVRTVLSRIQ